ncbi:hypothetical protein DDE83_004304 [Stemphylium lycopersici]|uniref:Zinc finger PHD-type domain-containing protein n=1 Tax=Stemphylium lycopersici TaxID=183478 RepID=A0A364N4X0_STELY|nr:hypothetical protein DDE83_004304 [Stemphylium lycopersici]
MASFIKPSRTSEYLQHTDPFHVHFSDLAIKPLSSDENVTYPMVVEWKPISESSGRKLGRYYMSIMEPITSHEVSRPFTPSPDNDCFKDTHSPSLPFHPSTTHLLPWGLIQPPTLKSLLKTNTPSRRAVQSRPDQKEEDYEKLGSAALNEASVPDFIIPGRKLGRGIDTKTVCSYFNNRRRIREFAMHKAKDIDICSFFTPINSANPDADLSDIPSDPSDQDSHTNYPEGIYPPTNRQSTKTPHSSSYRYQPVLRRRDTTIPMTPDPDISTWEQEAHLTRIPSPHQLICICHRPARTYEVALTQCANPGCVVDWYHKACLDRAGKLKARHGTYLCEQCALAQAIREREEKKGWTLEKAVQDEVGMPFSGREIYEALPGYGRLKAVADPYGLASFSSAAGAGAGAGKGMGMGIGVVGRKSRLSAEAKVFVPRPVVKSYAQALSGKTAVRPELPGSNL